MRKIMLIQHFGGFGGSGLSLYHIAHSIKQMSDKYDLYVYCPADPPILYNYLKTHGIKTIKTNNPPKIYKHYSGGSGFPFNINNLKSLLSIILFKKGWNDIKYTIEKIKPDIVAVNSMTLFWLGPLIKKMNIKTICFHRETYSKGIFGLRTKIIKSSLKKYFDAVIFISHFDRIQTGKINGIGKVITDKVNLKLYNIDTKSNSNEIGNTIPFRIVYLGGLSKLKGAHVILKALADLKNEDIKLIFLQYKPNHKNIRIGDRKGILKKIKFILGLDYESNVLKIINKFDLWGKIDFVPTVTNPEYYILQSDIVVFPSTKPHQARPIYEAGAAKKPIVITDFIHTSEFAINGYNCLTFKNNDHNDLANKIKMLKSNKELYCRLANNNYFLTSKNHNFETMASELEKVMESIYESNFNQ